MNYRIFPINENAVTIDFGNVVSVEINQKVIELAKFIERNTFKGFIETVPAYSSLTIFFDLLTVRRTYVEFPTAFSYVKSYFETSVTSLSTVSPDVVPVREIAVDYREKFAPDLQFVADTANLSKDEVIEIHTSRIYRVFMIGFLPGFAYMGEVDERIVTPRRQNPRTKIEKGSVGIAGKQTGIYPLESPGGWQIIGRTDLELFQPNNEQISVLKAGDLVKFHQLSK